MPTMKMLYLIVRAGPLRFYRSAFRRCAPMAIIESKMRPLIPKVAGSGTVDPDTLNSFAMFSEVGIHPLLTPVVLSAMGSSIPG